MNPESQQTQYEEDSIDLRSYILTLIRYWPLIVGMTLLAAVAAGIVSLRQIPVYEASARLVILQSRETISLEPRFMTLSEAELQEKQKVDIQARRDALAGLVQNAAVAKTVISRLGDRLPHDLQDIARLVDSVEGRVIKGDLIEITVRSTNPVTSALIANAWGEEYERYVNLVYNGGAGETETAIVQQVVRTKADYDTAQQAIIEFRADSRIDELNRQIQEKEHLVGSLQTGKQTAIASIIDEELNAQKEIVTAYLNAQAQNRLLAFNKEQQAKRQLLSQYIDAEVASRLMAFSMDRQARVDLFSRLAQAEIDSYTAVFDQQAEDRINRLVRAYTERVRLERLLDDARALLGQIEGGGDAATSTNALALILLKAEVFASSTALPGELQITMDAGSGLETNAADQQADVTALVGVLETRLKGVDEDIQVQSATLLGGDNYRFLTELTASNLVVSSPLTQTIVALQPVSETVSTFPLIPNPVTADSMLSNAIRQRYLDLFTVGGLSESSQELATGTPLFDSIEDLYPDLFKLSALSQLTEDVQSDNPLAQTSATKAQQLLALQGLEQLPTYTAAAEPLTLAIAELQTDVRILQSDLELERAKEKELTRARDLAWETYTTVARKAAELDVASAVTGTVVRFAAPAVEPLAPVGAKTRQNVLLAGVVGLLMAIGAGFFIDYMKSGYDPAAA